jgi:hypothetical protein
MFNTVVKFGTYPTNVKRGIVCLTLGWIMHLVVYFNYFTGEALVRNDYLMAAVGIAICYFVASINTWARALSLFFNLGILVIYLALLVIPTQDLGLGQLKPMTVIALFALATYFLLHKDVAEFFRSFNAAETHGDEKKDDTGPFKKR